MKIISLSKSLLVTLIAATAPWSACAVSLISYSSSPASWVGAGQTVLVTAPEFKFSATRNFHNGISVSVDNFPTFPNMQPSRWWYLDFAAPFDATLQAGYYGNAVIWPFQPSNAAGFEFSGNGRGDDSVTASFSILDVVYDIDGSVLSFAADFLQFDDQDPRKWNAGSIRINSDVAVTSVPEPEILVLLGLGGPCIVFVARRRRARIAARKMEERSAAGER